MKSRGIWNAQPRIMSELEYVPNLTCGDRVLFIGKDDDPRSGQQCTIIRGLPNPSMRAENQWYDVRFDDYSTGRFVGRHIVRLAANGKETAA
jgi:hypothetical protein